MKQITLNSRNAIQLFGPKGRIINRLHILPEFSVEAHPNHCINARIFIKVDWIYWSITYISLGEERSRSFRFDILPLLSVVWNKKGDAFNSSLIDIGWLIWKVTIFSIDRTKNDRTYIHYILGEEQGDEPSGIARASNLFKKEK